MEESDRVEDMLFGPEVADTKYSTIFRNGCCSFRKIKRQPHVPVEAGTLTQDLKIRILVPQYRTAYTETHAMSKLPKGIILALCTTFDGNAELELSLVAPMVESLLGHKIGGFFVCGSTDEGIAYSS